MTFTHQREYAQWITSAKKQPTREGRLAKLVNIVAERSAVSVSRRASPGPAR